MNLDTGVQLLESSKGSLSTVLADEVCVLPEEELGSKVRFGDGCAVEDGEGADAGEDEVLGNLIGEGSHGDEEDVCALNLGLGGHAPEADLAIIKGDFLCMESAMGRE